MILGDLGADVIKVERPGRGDETRGWGPPFDARGESAYYLSVNRNKLGITRRPRRRRGSRAHRAAGRRGGRRRRQLSARDARAARRRAGCAGAIGDRDLSGARSPASAPGVARPGYDFVVQAESGWMAITGEPDGDPMKVGVALADVLAGKDAAIAILAALVVATRDRQGTAHRHLARRQRRERRS